ncbi:MAG: hypothetical protein ETSY2_32225 [Candidatus Entotheonella gemina]|uniref:Uncharacterized protein n=1 Tax=Candidatus Entotheonella gemina TaxID=1429439 RepID=W4M0K2_9BACT|nr:MAG: hypothetical protein ETSY2_32225 [Candidatus Entotheonella gemina]
MRLFITSIPGLIYQGMIFLFTQWRDLHARSSGWGPHEQPWLIDEPAPSKTHASTLVSST